MTYEQAADLMTHLEKKNYVTKNGNMTKFMKDDMKDLHERVVIVEQSTKQAHKRLDEQFRPRGT